MINLMYLVLTALLAMNVSSEILNAFKTIQQSIANSNKSVEERNNAVTGAFADYIKDPKTNAEKKAQVVAAQGLAEQVNQKTTVLITQIDKYKEMIIASAGGRNEDSSIKRIDDLDAGTRVMIEEGNGEKFLQMLKDYKAEVAGLVPLLPTSITAPGKGNNPEIEKVMPLNFEFVSNEHAEKNDWVHSNFYMSPTIANVALLDKYKSDVLASQSVALDRIWSIATGEKLNKEFIHPTPITNPDYLVMVSAENNYLLPGEKYKARIVMGTYNKKLNNLRFNVNGQTITAVNGVAEYTAIATGAGPKQINVSATFMDSVAGTRTVQARTIKMEKPAQYFVGEAQASISLDKMNVFYIGVDNPITLSASGVPAGSLVATPEGCTLTKSEGVNKYQVRANAQGKAYISLSAKLSDGTTKNFGKYEYRVKRIPDPKAQFAGKFNGSLGANEARSQLAVFAKLEGFDFDAKFNVISFDLFYQPKRGEPKDATSNTMYTNGPNAEADVKAIMDKLKPGDKLFFDNIRAKGPDGQSRNIGALMYNINS